ncbi:hypothetical protein SDC9_209918 [bioreactor metagenome]|uniref:Uncharacterized protein n=1 Tax=bioreactor metagenome TaxID=1076179 RepID=A0A645JEY5_9ZZZZ
MNYLGFLYYVRAHLIFGVFYSFGLIIFTFSGNRLELFPLYFLHHREMRVLKMVFKCLIKSTYIVKPWGGQPETYGLTSFSIT